MRHFDWSPAVLAAPLLLAHCGSTHSQDAVRSSAAGRAGANSVGTGGSDAAGAGGSMAGSDRGGGTAGDNAHGGGAGVDSRGGAGGSGGGRGGTGSGPGGMGGVGPPDCGPSQGRALVIHPGPNGATGRMDANTNCFGIQGDVVLQEDEEGSFIYFTSTDGHLCVAGNLRNQPSAAVTSTQYGAKILIELDGEGDGVTRAYDALEHAVVGFSFDLTGATIPPEIRPLLRTPKSAADYCERVCAGGAQSVLIDRTLTGCTLNTGAAPDPTALTYLVFFLPARPDGDTPFDFCIDDLAVLTDESGTSVPDTCSNAGGGGGSGTGGSGGGGGGLGGLGGTDNGGTATGGMGLGGENSCVGHCADQAASGCWCDSHCSDFGDCCPDRDATCLP